MNSRLIAAALLGTLVFGRSMAADFSIKTSAAVEMVKKGSTATGGNLDDAFVRAETNLAGKNDKGLSGLVHLRFQSDFMATNVGLTIRQAYFKVPVSILTFTGGRWYEIYTPGAYFGKYLFGVGSIKDGDNVIGQGNGSMCTSYSILDGLRLAISALKEEKLEFHLAVLPSIKTLEDVYTLAMVTSKPVKGLSLSLGSTIHTLVPEDAERVHRLDVSAKYEIIEKLSVFAEYAITDFADVGDNSWVLAGLTVPAWKILDELRFEMEYNPDRMVSGSDADFAWMVLLTKSVLGLKFNLNVGADPKVLGSEGPGDVGVILRVTYAF